MHDMKFHRHALHSIKQIQSQILKDDTLQWVYSVVFTTSNEVFKPCTVNEVLAPSHLVLSPMKVNLREHVIPF